MPRTGSKGSRQSAVGGAKRRSAKPNDGKSHARKSAPKARTATGKKADPATLAAAASVSREGLRERTEAGHRAAGRTPPSEVSSKKTAGATRVVDDAIRSYAAQTEDQKLLESPPSSGADFTRT